MTVCPAPESPDLLLEKVATGLNKQLIKEEKMSPNTRRHLLAKFYKQKACNKYLTLDQEKTKR